MYFDSRFCIGCNLHINCKLITVLYTYRIFYANNSIFLIYVNKAQGRTLIEEAMAWRAKLVLNVNIKGCQKVHRWCTFWYKKKACFLHLFSETGLNVVTLHKQVFQDEA